jgi:hypothetical protein
MILPEGEEIVWVDHWWKHPPPWNTTYVRDLWEDGYEVDSFHSFHWYAPFFSALPPECALQFWGSAPCGASYLEHTESAMGRLPAFLQ